MIQTLTVLCIVIACVSATPGAVLAGYAAPVVAPAVVTAHSSQVIARNHNGLVARFVAAAPLIQAAAVPAPIVTQAQFAKAVAAPVQVVAGPAVAAPVVRASPFVAAPAPVVKAAPFIAASAPLKTAAYVANPAVAGQVVYNPYTASVVAPLKTAAYVANPAVADPVVYSPYSGSVVAAPLRNAAYVGSPAVASPAYYNPYAAYYL